MSANESHGPSASREHSLRAQALEALETVIDPEVGLNVVDLGLVYEIRVSDEELTADLIMTSPTCPLGEVILADAERALSAIPGAGRVRARIVRTATWTPQRMTEEARRTLGWGE